MYMYIAHLGGGYMYITYIHSSGISGKRDLRAWQKRPKKDLSYGKRDLSYGKRDLSYGKRDLRAWQKRPARMTKETRVYGKRDPRV